MAKVTLEQVTSNAKHALQQAVDSERFCVFVAYVEDGRLNFHEGRYDFPTGDFPAFSKYINEVIEKAKG